MSVFRIEKNKNYTVMSNHHLRNKELSLKAKGLLSQMLSLPENWDYTLAGLSHINKESIDAIRTAVWELEKAGYIKRQQGRDEKGKMTAIEYIIYEQPQLENPAQGNCVYCSHCQPCPAGIDVGLVSKYFAINRMPVVASQYWNGVHGSTPDDVRKDEEGLQTMRTRGHNMAYLLKSIAEGKQPLPVLEPWQPTHFYPIIDFAGRYDRSEGVYLLLYSLAE